MYGCAATYVTLSYVTTKARFGEHSSWAASPFSGMVISRLVGQVCNLADEFNFLSLERETQWCQPGLEVSVLVL